MKGLEICERYFHKYGEPMIAEKYPELLPRAAFGLAGEGSECLGFDDEVSRDHDFEPSFCIWLTDEDFEKYSFALSRAYSALPREYLGLKRSNVAPTGGARRGVMRISDFYMRFLGSADAPSSDRQWLAIPEHSLAAATSGKVFRDDGGDFSAVRNTLIAGYPRDVKLKKLAAYFIVAAQSGEYNYKRCLSHGEAGAAQLAIFTFVKNVAASIYLLNGVYMPFYKWVFRGMKDLPVLSDLSDVLEFLISSGNTATEKAAKHGIISDLSTSLLTEAVRQGYIKDPSVTFEQAAYEINSKISSPALRNDSIFEGMIRE